MKSISFYLQEISFFLGNYFILSQVIFSFLCPGYFHSLAWPIFIPCLAYFHSLAWDISLVPAIFMINYRQMPAQFCVHCLESYDMRFLRQLEWNVYHSLPGPCLGYISFLPGYFSFHCLGYFISLPRVFFIPAWLFFIPLPGVFHSLA